MSETYTCAACGGEFEKGWSDEEALAEAGMLWPDVPEEDMEAVCDDCFVLDFSGITGSLQ